MDFAELNELRERIAKVERMASKIGLNLSVHDQAIGALDERVTKLEKGEKTDKPKEEKTTPATTPEGGYYGDEIENGQPYWYIDHYGETECEDWDGGETDQWRRDTGNVFRTEDDALFYRKKLMAEHTLRKAGGFHDAQKAAEQGQRSYWIHVRYPDDHGNYVLTPNDYPGLITPNMVAFKTPTDAENAIKDHANEIKILMGVKEDV